MLDEKDRRILAQLRENAKATTKSIAQETGIPRTTVHDRIMKMEDRGVIRSYTAVPNYEHLGLPTTAFVFLTFESSAGVDQGEVCRQLSDAEGVFEVHMISGDWDLIAKVRGRSVEHIGDIVIRNLRAIPGVGKTLTCTVFRTAKEEV